MWIQDGRLSYVVNEVTIAGNLFDMFKDIDGVADILDRMRVVFSLVFWICEMMVVGV